MEHYSVLITVYKSDNPEYFKLALESMVNQSIKPEQIVLVCDGELTKQHDLIIEKFEAENLGLFTTIRLKQNEGLWNALNVGLKRCRNSIVARMDADDIAVKNRCEIQLREFEKDKKLEYLGSYAKEFIDSTENVVSIRKVPLSQEDIRKYARTRNPFNHPTVMYRAESIKKIGGYKKMKRCEDYELAVRLIMNNAVCRNLPNCLLYYRLTEDTFNRRKNWNNTKGFIYVRYLNWRKGFTPFLEFAAMTALQMFLFVMPISVTRFFYQKILRKRF